MFWSKPPLSFLSSVILSLLLLMIGSGLASCSDRTSATETVILESTYEPVVTAKLAEVAPPTVIKELSKSLDQYQPQVRILSPQPDQLFSDTVVNVSLDVQDYPLFKDETFEMGPHLHFILDNEPYKAIYEVNKTINLENLTPGTHTLRVFAARPWHESFKNDGAYAQTTFHIFTKTDDNAPDPNLPLLTYSRPKGNYGAEPILLDYYLTNAPLHIYTPDEDENTPPDWRIRVTINGESFLVDNWQPIYLTGFQEGGNWVKLEFIDEQGNPLKNAFNDTARLITYTPNGTDTLSKLVRGELSAEMVRAIVNPHAPMVSRPETETTERIEEEETEMIEEPKAVNTKKTEKIEEIEEPETSEQINAEIPESTPDVPSEESGITPEAELIEPSTPPVEIMLEIEPEPAISEPEATKETPEPEPPVSPQPIPEKSSIETKKPITSQETTISEPETPISPSEVSHEDLSDLNATELQLKLLESIEKLEQKLDNLPENAIETEFPQSSLSSDAESMPETSIVKESDSDNIQSLRNDLKTRLQKWREMLKMPQS